MSSAVTWFPGTAGQVAQAVPCGELRTYNAYVTYVTYCTWHDAINEYLIHRRGSKKTKIGELRNEQREHPNHIFASPTRRRLYKNACRIPNNIG